MYDIYNHLAVFGLLFVSSFFVVMQELEKAPLLPLIISLIILVLGEIGMWSVMYLLGYLP